MDTTTELVNAARNLFAVASRKGMLFVTDPESGSDKLVGFFVPADQMNTLGAAIVRFSAAPEN